MIGRKREQRRQKGFAAALEALGSRNGLTTAPNLLVRRAPANQDRANPLLSSDLGKKKSLEHAEGAYKELLDPKCFWHFSGDPQRGGGPPRQGLPMRISRLHACVMPKGRPINNPELDEAVFAAHLTGETMASIAERLGLNIWNVNDACKRVRTRRRMEARRSEFADWRNVPIRYSGLSARTQDAIPAMKVSTMGALFLAVEAHSEALFKYAPNVGPKTIAEINAWFEGVLKA